MPVLKGFHILLDAYVLTLHSIIINMAWFSWFKRKNKQLAKDIHDSEITQVAGDQHIHNEVSLETMNTLLVNMKSVIQDVVRSELMNKSEIARQVTTDRTMQFDEAFTEKLSNPSNAPLLEKFNRPDVQRILRTSLIQFIDKGDEETKEELVDLLIDRLNFDDKSIEQAVVDEAIVTLPKLSDAACSLLVFMYFRQLAFAGDSMTLMTQFQIMGKLAEKLANLTMLDVAYLRQQRCCDGFEGLKQFISYEQILLKNYGDFFRDYGNQEQVSEIFSAHPELQFNIDNRANFVIDGISNNRLVFSYCRRDYLRNKLNQAGLEDRYTSITSYLDSCPLFDEFRVRQEVVNHSDSWNFVFDNLNKENVQTMNLTPLGIYIAKKVLKRNLGYETPSLAESIK